MTMHTGHAQGAFIRLGINANAHQRIYYRQISLLGQLQQFFLRAGYFYENKFKGNRQYFGIGAGFSLNVVRLDASYMLATAQTSPLDQTLRFTLTFDMDGLRDLLGKRKR